jgi:beta-phosphoglucomutase-like phosphatase (HAD superfamily)
MELLPASAKTEDLEHAVSLYLGRYSILGLYQSTAYEGMTEMLAQLRDSTRPFVVASKVTANAERILQALCLRATST